MAAIVEVPSGRNLVAESRDSDEAYRQVGRELQDALVNSIDLIHPGFRHRVCRSGAVESFFNREILR